MSLENKGRIRILRGNASNESVKTVSLYDGQPFYDTNSKHLYIGDRTHTIENTTPIIADANNIIFYCETPSNVSKKEINLPGYKLINEQKAFIKFANDFTTVDNTLSINGSEEKEIIFDGKTFVYNDITDLTGYTVDWYNGDSKSITIFTVEQEQPLIFKSNGQWFRGIRSPQNEEIQYITNSGTIISVSSNNKSEIQPNYRYMEIIGGGYAVNTDFIGILKQYKKPIYLTNSIKKDIVYELYCGNKIYINSLNAKYATYASEDISKGTIEERLTNLGFKQGSVTLSETAKKYFDESTFEINLKRQGNYVLIDVTLFGTSSLFAQIKDNKETSISLGYIKESNNFKPIDVSISVPLVMEATIIDGGDMFQLNFGACLTIRESGEVLFVLIHNAIGSGEFSGLAFLHCFCQYNIGYEAKTL